MYGHRSKPVLAPTPNQSVFGIVVPDNRGSLVSRMAARKRYLEQVSQTLVNQRLETPSGPGRMSTHDSGHEMVSIKIINSQRQTMREIMRSTGALYQRAEATAIRFIDAPDWVPVDDKRVMRSRGNSVVGLTASDWPGGSPWPTGLDHQGAINSLFQRSIPDNPGSQIGETLVSFLTGDYPKLWTGLLQFQRKLDAAGGKRVVQETLKEAGSSYLNVVFGWVPTIGDLIKFIETLLHIDSLIYGETERRKRGDIGGSKTATKRSYGAVGGMQSMIRGSGEEETAISFFSPYYTARATSTWDRRLSARYAGLARPNKVSESFVDKAYETLRNTGVVYDQIVWDLTPFSWLVDWFLSIGSSIANASAFSPSSGRWNVDYAYVTTAYNLVANGEFETMYNRAYATDWYTSGRKTFGVQRILHRQQATPFGFGTRLDGLSASQFAILAALGLAKSR